jgi:hypothetical protein
MTRSRAGSTPPSPSGSTPQRGHTCTSIFAMHSLQRFTSTGGTRSVRERPARRHDSATHTRTCRRRRTPARAPESSTPQTPRSCSIAEARRSGASRTARGHGTARLGTTRRCSTPNEPVARHLHPLPCAGDSQRHPRCDGIDGHNQANARLCTQQRSQWSPARVAVARKQLQSRTM